MWIENELTVVSPTSNIYICMVYLRYPAKTCWTRPYMTNNQLAHLPNQDIKHMENPYDMCSLCECQPWTFVECKWWRLQLDDINLQLVASMLTSCQINGINNANTNYQHTLENTRNRNTSYIEIYRVDMNHPILSVLKCTNSWTTPEIYRVLSYSILKPPGPFFEV